MGITKLLSGVHTVRETEASRFFQRHLNDPDIVTIWNHETQNWILAYWVDKDKGFVDEIDDLGPNFEMMTRDFVKSLEATRQTTHVREHKEKILRNAKRRMFKECEKVQADQERWDWLRKKTKDKCVVPFSMGGGKTTGGMV